MKKGDLVRCLVYSKISGYEYKTGVIIGFNKKGEGGKEYVHVLCDDNIRVIPFFNVEVIDEKR